MSLMLLGILNSQAAGGSVAYWITTLGSAGFDTANGLGIDSADNIYVFGETDPAGTNDDFLFVKYDTLGAIQWQRTLGDTSNEDSYGGVGIDSSDNAYVVGGTASEGAGSRDCFIAKYNSSGTVQWQRILGGASYEQFKDVKVDSSDNVYASGVTNSQGTGQTEGLLAKYNTSGTLQWQRLLGVATSNDSLNGVAFDSSDNIYVAGVDNNVNDMLLAKYNSSGTLQWQRLLGDGGEYGNYVTVDSSDNVYIVGRGTSEGAGSTSAFIAKYNSSGAIQWQRVLGGTGSDYFSSIAIDSQNNLYTVGRTDSEGEGSSDIFIAKYDSDGVIQWQRIIGGAGFEWSNTVEVDSTGAVCMAGRTDGVGIGAEFITIKIPSDGSLTGTYTLNSVDIVYAASTLTPATSTLTASTASQTAATATLTAATSTLTAATPSYTSYFVEL